MLKTKKDLIAHCLTYPDVYEDYPFHDHEWAVIRHRSNRREFWRKAYPGVLPGYHLNKKYWNTVLLDGTVPDKEIRRMIAESYDLTR
mgnify:CR=1 FL=1